MVASSGILVPGQPAGAAPNEGAHQLFLPQAMQRMPAISFSKAS